MPCIDQHDIFILLSLKVAKINAKTIKQNKSPLAYKLPKTNSGFSAYKEHWAKPVLLWIYYSRNTPHSSKKKKKKNNFE